MANRIQLRRDSQSNWENINPILADGEPGLNYNNNQIKIGNGTDTWTMLSYALLVVVVVHLVIFQTMVWLIAEVAM